MMMATAVTHKGGRGGFAVDRCLDSLDENGDSQNSILANSDAEESMRFFVQSDKEDRPGGKTVVEEAPKKVKGSNGVVERA
eukprot:6625679-Karenia_brevis.AAC.1